jgi:hypothetical protein
MSYHYLEVSFSMARIINIRCVSPYCTSHDGRGVEKRRVNNQSLGSTAVALRYALQLISITL